MSNAASRVGSSAIRDLLALTDRPDVISLAGGLPAPDGFPMTAIADATALVLRDPSSLQYGPTEGHPGLREWIGANRGVDPEQVLITHGSQQALDLVVRALVEPGATVAIADPAYVGALQVLRLGGAEVLGVSSDHHGMDVDALAEALDRGVHLAAVHVVADFQNPTGATLSEERRAFLFALAARHRFVVIEDDPYGELRWGGVAPRSLVAHAAEAGCPELLITLGTFSKVLAPGLRVGYSIAPPEVGRDLVIVKQAADLHTSTLAQRVIERVVRDPDFYDAHVAGLRVRYRERADALVGALQLAFGDRLTCTDPDGGMFVWATVDGVDDSDALLTTALDHGVAFVPGSAFAVDRRPTPGFRLSFATASPPELDEAVARLHAAVEVASNLHRSLV